MSVLSDSVSWKKHCTLCPRACAANRNAGGTACGVRRRSAAFCGEGAALRLAWAGLHFGEEPPVTGAGGSGTVFVTGCNLRCSFCQNYQISREGMGAVVSVDEFAGICLALEKAGAENINIVTGSHSVPALADGLRAAVRQGLSIPVLWNSSGYESVESLRLLEGLVSVWLPDLKSFDADFSYGVFRARDYPEVAAAALGYMVNAAPLSFASGRGGSEVIRSGVIVRHLALPGRLEDTRRVLTWFKENAADKAFLSLMTQYTPVPKAGAPFASGEGGVSLGEKAAFPQRYTTKDEYNRLLETLDSLEIENGFLQELNPDSEWLPDFSRVQPFSSSLAKPVWHWRCGFVSAQNENRENHESRV